MAKTMIEKIWESHEVRGPAQQDGASLLYVDLHLVHEVTSPQAFDGLRMTGRKLHESAVIAIPGRPVSIVLKRGLPQQTMFLFRPDRTLSGLDYPPGDNLLTIACTLDEDDQSKVLITGLPQVRTTYHRPQFVDRTGVVSHRPSPHPG